MREKLNRRSVAFTARCTEATDYILQGCASVIKGSKGDVLEYLADNFLDPKHDYRYIKLTDRALHAVNVLAFNNHVTREEYLDLLLAREVYGPRPVGKQTRMVPESHGPRETISVAVDDWIVKQLDERAADANRTRSEYVRDYLKHCLLNGAHFDPPRPLSDFANKKSSKIEA